MTLSVILSHVDLSIGLQVTVSDKMDFLVMLCLLLHRYNNEEKKLRRALLQHHMLGECVISGANTLHDVALSECGSFEELPGVHYVIPPGFESIIQILGQNVPQEAVFLNHVVTKVTWNDGTNTGMTCYLYRNIIFCFYMN